MDPHHDVATAEICRHGGEIGKEVNQGEGEGPDQNRGIQPPRQEDVQGHFQTLDHTRAPELGHRVTVRAAGVGAGAEVWVEAALVVGVGAGVEVGNGAGVEAGAGAEVGARIRVMGGQGTRFLLGRLLV